MHNIMQQIYSPGSAPVEETGGPLVPWTLIEEGIAYLEIDAPNGASALAVAVANVNRRNYDADPNETIYIDVMARQMITGESWSDTVKLEPVEPPCKGNADDAKPLEHKWQSPYEVVGGSRDNPGVRGHGGGVIMTECCARCGQYRTTDTWATNPKTGKVAWAVRYAPADARSHSWVFEGDDDHPQPAHDDDFSSP